MKIEKLTDNKIRIILGTDDLENKNMTLQDFMSDTLKYQGFFIEILNKAEKEVGFVTKDCKLLIEAFSSPDGVFVFTITKYSKNTENEYKSKKKIISVKRKTINLSNTCTIYSFTNFDEFCNFCNYINCTDISIRNIAKNMSLYLYKNTYYLVLSKINIEHPKLKQFYALISEFAKLIGHSKNFEGKLSEHGKLIIKRNAISTGIKFFCTK